MAGWLGGWVACLGGLPAGAHLGLHRCRPTPQLGAHLGLHRCRSPPNHHHCCSKTKQNKTKQSRILVANRWETWRLQMRALVANQVVSWQI